MDAERPTAGRVIAAAARLVGRTAPRVAAIAAAAAAPVAAAGLLVPPDRHPAAAVAALLLLDVPIAAVVTHAGLAALRDTPAPLRPTLAAAARRAPAVLGVLALVHLVTAALGVALLLPIGAAGTRDAPGAAALVMLAAWAAAALALHSRWLLAVPAAVTERPGLGGALDRSGALTAGHRAHLAAVLVALAAAAAAAALAAHVALGRPTSVTPAVWLAAVTLWTALSVARAAAAAAAYHLAAGAADATSPDGVARVFE